MTVAYPRWPPFIARLRTVLAEFTLIGQHDAGGAGRRFQGLQREIRRTRRGEELLGRQYRRRLVAGVIERERGRAVIRQIIVQCDGLPFVPAERLIERRIKISAELFARTGREAVPEIVAEREILEAEGLADSGAYRLQQILGEFLAEETARAAARMDPAAARGFDAGHRTERLRVDE